MAPSSPGSSAGTYRTAVGLALCTAIAAANAWPNLWTAVDDAFISARYAEHLASGNGWTWNVGQPAVEGFSNPLWTAWIAVGLWLGAPAHGWMVGWGLVGWLGAIPASWLLARELAEPTDRDGPGLWLAPVALASSPLLAVAATNGLETSWFLTGLLVLGWLTLAVESSASLVVVGVGLGLLAWLRPEGLAVGPGWIALRAISGRSVRPAIAGWATPVVGLFVWRMLTFGTWLPNTAGAKLGGHGWALTVERNLAYLGRDALTWMAVGACAVGTGLGGSRRPMVTGPLLLAAVLLAPAALVELWMPGGRLLLPGLVLTAVSGAALLARRSRWAALALVLVLLQWLPGPQQGARHDDRIHSVLPANGSALAGRWLRAHAPEGASMVVRDAGCLAFHAGPAVTVYENHERALTRVHPDRISLPPELPDQPTVVVLTQSRKRATGVRYPTDEAVLRALPAGAYRDRGRVYQHHHRYYDLYVLEAAELPELAPGVVVATQPPR